jgi:hypothetical protein
MSKYQEYKIIHVAEGGCGTVFLGSSGLPLKKLEATLNEEAANGWNVVFQVLENKRFMLFWSREAVILTLGR